jgi:malate dehydrogenase (quinone)
MMYKTQDQYDITLVGGGVMSLTLAVLINELNPKFKIHIIEKLPACARESSSPLNNAGTGHAGYCELNYTPNNNEGEIIIKRAIEINEMFEVSLQFWAYLDKKYSTFKPKKFLKKTPHISFVWGEKNVELLKKRFLALKKQPLFKEMEFAKDYKTIKNWSPLLIEGRKLNECIAATKVSHGADVNFGELTTQLLQILLKNKNFSLSVDTNVTKIKRANEQKWIINTTNSNSNKKLSYESKVVFIGAGGMAINLLQQMKLKEAFGYAGYPVSGKWLISHNKSLIKKHKAKVYSHVLPKAPPMSIPHLDLRVIDGSEILLFGPFAGFSFKFLKYGSSLDLFKSIKRNNIKTLIFVMFKNLSLLVYLIKQALMSNRSRVNQLKGFYPNVKNKDWTTYVAGQRVQIIKNCRISGPKLEFGTEIIFAKNNNLAALLGASPGASVAASSMIKVLNKLFNSERNKSKLQKIIPSYGYHLNKKPALLRRIRTKTYKQLGLW